MHRKHWKNMASIERNFPKYLLNSNSIVSENIDILQASYHSSADMVFNDGLAIMILYKITFEPIWRFWINATIYNVLWQGDPHDLILSWIWHILVSSDAHFCNRIVSRFCLFFGGRAAGLEFHLGGGELKKKKLTPYFPWLHRLLPYLFSTICFSRLKQPCST